jgi:hypothetical protein
MAGQGHVEPQICADGRRSGGKAGSTMSGVYGTKRAMLAGVVVMLKEGPDANTQNLLV